MGVGAAFAPHAVVRVELFVGGESVGSPWLCVGQQQEEPMPTAEGTDSDANATARHGFGFGFRLPLIAAAAAEEA